MSATVQMFRMAAEPRGRDRFSCSLHVWELLREIGETFGWQPMGTTYITPPNRNVDTSVRHNYQPGDALDHKCVEAADALAWARALEVAKRSPHFAAMMKSRSAASDVDLVGELLPGLLAEFIEFAYGGTFTFAISPDPGR